MEFFTAYGPRNRVVIDCSVEPDLAKQSFKDECDINNIMARYERTGLLDYVNEHQAQYGDVTGMEFTAAMDTVVRGNEMFDALPAGVRKRFHNDQAEFLDFVFDPVNDAECVRMGLKRAPEPSGGGSPSAKDSGAAGASDPAGGVS